MISRFDKYLKMLEQPGVVEAQVQNTLNEYSRFDQLKLTVDKTKAQSFFQRREGRAVSPFETNKKIHSFLKDLITGSGVGP